MGLEGHCANWWRPKGR